MNKIIKEKLALVPNLPGSYQMLNKDGVIIYVGKAKNLHKRVSSYFNRTHTGKTAKMVSLIEDFNYIVANSELEAFIMEINLIKKYNPKYNIMLTDDKSYPYIEYISKPYPKLKVSRYLNIKKKEHKKLFGPYPNAYAARRIVSLINRIYPLKKCEGNPKNVCLYYHIGECLGYCTKNISKEKINAMETEILSFLRGNDTILKDKIMEKIAFYSQNLNYEMALELKKELEYINIIMAKQKVELHDFVNRDVINYYFDKGYIAIEIFYIRNGKLLGSKSDIFPITGEEGEELELYITKFYQKHELPKEVLVPDTINKELLNGVLETSFITPLKGQKKSLLDMAYMNAKLTFEREHELVVKDEKRTLGANETLRKLLGLDELVRIDIFDNSNLFGNFAVSGMVVYINGKPCKSEFRKYKVSVEVNDDYNTMKEIIYRRYYRALMEKSNLPELIIVDGGELQITAAKDVLESLNLPIKVVGLKKNDKHRTNDLVDSNLETISIDRTSDLFHYLTRMQDEVHRYTINYHRTLRSKNSIASVLDEVEGIGPKRKKELIKKYGSLNKIKEASIEDLEKYLPLNVAKNLKEYLDIALKK